MQLEPVVLEGRWLRLEPLGEQHISGLWEAAQHPAIWTWIPFRVSSRDDVRALVERAALGLRMGMGLGFAQIDRASGAVIGSTSYLAVEAQHRRLEIGATWLTPRWQRSAANTEAKRLLLAHAFEVLGCNRVEFKTDIENLRSRAAIARLGAVEEGIFRAHMVRPDGKLRDSVYFSIVRSEWPAVRERLDQRLARGDAQAR